MSISLLISTYNWEEALELCLNSVLQQTVLPDEVLIADDGSQEATAQLIQSFAKQAPFPIVHVWHEDKGFRKTKILNKALLKSTHPYIIQIDGDVILNRHFIADHIELAEKGYFVGGSRVLLGKVYTTHLLKRMKKNPTLFKQNLSFILNGFRSRLLRKFLSKRYANHRMNSVRGCNMAFWRDDAFRVNGYNEALEMWGQEDQEFAYRLYHTGIQKKQLKMGGVQFHIYHKQKSKENLEYHDQVLSEVIRNKATWCSDGIDKAKNTEDR